MSPSWRFLFLPFSALVLLSCYPTEERHDVKKWALAEGQQVSAPTKIHLTDGSILLCTQGFRIRSDTIFVAAFRYNLSRRDSTLAMWAIPLDEVAALEYFDKSVRGARILGSLLLGATVTAEVALGALVVYKAIFGSCPTVYSVEGESEQLEAECFSYSIGRQFEMADMDRLLAQEEPDQPFVLRVKNEALETHYINKFLLGFVDHPAGTEVFPTDEGQIVTCGNFVSALTASNSQGIDVSPYLQKRDHIVYRCDSASLYRMFTEKKKDWIEFAVPLPPKATNLTVALRGRNSLQNTVLLYDVMMRNQGLNVLEWSKDINDSWWYAWKLANWYEEFSGIDILVWEDGAFVSRGHCFDTGPIAWKLAAAQFPLHATSDTVRIRLEFLPDNWAIDWVGFDFGGTESASISIAEFSGATTNGIITTENLLRALREDDDDYFVQYPGDCTELSFALPARERSMERTFFSLSKGYYVEWVRPEWVRQRPGIPGFDFSQREETAQRLSELWLTKKDGFEYQFHESKIPTMKPEVRP